MTHALYSNIPSVTKRKLKHPPLQLSNLIWPVLNTKIGYETHEPMMFGITEVKSLTCYIIRDNENMNDIWKLQWWRLPMDKFLFFHKHCDWFQKTWNKEHDSYGLLSWVK